MKHLFNNLSSEEKQRILEQHKGGIEVEIKNFKKLVENKLGNVKPLLEQSVTTTTTAAQSSPSPAVKQKLDEFIVELKKIPYYQKENTFGYGPNGKSVYFDIQYGEEIVKFDKGFDLDSYSPCDRSSRVLYDETTQKYSYCPHCARSCYDGLTLEQAVRQVEFPEVEEQTTPTQQEGFISEQETQAQGQETQTKKNPEVKTKIATEGIKNVSADMISSPPFLGTYSGYVFGGTFNGTDYWWDCSGVEGMSGVRTMVEGKVLTENNSFLGKQTKKEITDADPKGVFVGFLGSYNTRFVVYMTTEGKPKCVYF